MSISRRRLLTVALAGGGLTLAAGAGGVAAVWSGVLPGRTRLGTLVDGVLPVDDPTCPPGPVRRGSFVSPAQRGARVRWLVAYPPGTAGVRPLPVVVALHGQGDDAGVVERLAVPGYLADAVRAGVAPFAVAAVDGGTGYWHRRRSGEDASATVVEEFLPMLARLDGPPLATGRIGLTGWSMGGYGALLLAERLGAARVAAVAAVSPALWHDAASAAPGAFDDAADFARHDVFAGRGRLRGVGVRVDCGSADPFADAARAFVAGLPAAAAAGFGFGGHEDAYWRRTAPTQLAFLGDALA